MVNKNAAIKKPQTPVECREWFLPLPRCKKKEKKEQEYELEKEGQGK